MSGRFPPSPSAEGRCPIADAAGREARNAWGAGGLPAPRCLLEISGVCWVFLEEVFCVASTDNVRI